MWAFPAKIVRLRAIFIALARFVQRRLSFTVGDCVSAFRVKLGANDLNFVDMPLNPIQSLHKCFVAQNGVSCRYAFKKLLTYVINKY